MDQIRLCADENEGESGMIEVVAALLCDKERVLLCQRPENKARALGWEFPGGKIEKGETPARAIERELQEELDVQVRAGDIVAETTYAYPDVTVHLMLLRCTLTQGEPVRREHRDMRFMTLEEAKRCDLCPADRALIEQIET